LATLKGIRGVLMILETPSRVLRQIDANEGEYNLLNKILIRIDATWKRQWNPIIKYGDRKLSRRDKALFNKQLFKTSQNHTLFLFLFFFFFSFFLGYNDKT
jgi:hypothetical protein